MLLKLFFISALQKPGTDNKNDPSKSAIASLSMW